MVTVCDWAGPSLVPNDQLHVPPALLPAFVTVPTEAVSVHRFGGVGVCDQIPEFDAVAPSFTVTVALSLAMVGAAF